MKARANKSYAALIVLIIIIFIVQCTVLCIETNDARVALAENVNQIPTDECAYFTDNDNINNSSATIRDYPELRTTPTMTFNSGEYVLETQEDDLIVNIIPKELFKVVGDKTYIGKEYGFFVHTESPAVAPLNMYSTVIVFDIINQVDMDATNDRAKFSVEVLYQYAFVYLSPQESFYYLLSNIKGIPAVDGKVAFSADKSDIVIPLGVRFGAITKYDEVEYYFLKDISFAATLQNVQAPNYGDTNYNPYEDIGSFFIGSQYFYKGTEIINGEITNEDKIEWGLQLGLTFLGQFISFPANLGFFAVDAMLILKDYLEITSDKYTSVSNDSIICETEKTTRNRQLEDNGIIAKSAGIAINTTKEQSYIYRTSDYARIEFLITDSASSNNAQKENSTLITREISLKVVDDEHETVDVVTNSHDFKLYEEDYVDVNLNGGTAYLLPNESNTFTFVPEYSGEYSFDFGAGNNNVEFVVNGQAVNVGTNGFDVGMTGGETYDIRVSNKTDVRQIYDFSTEPSSDSTVSIGNHDEYVVKWSLTSPQFKTLTTDKSNINIEVYVKNANGTLDLYAPGGYAWISAPSMSFPFPAGEYYIVLKNITSSAVTATLSANDVPVVTEGGNDVTFGRNWTYYRFTPSAASYTLTLDTDVDFAQMQLYDSSLQSVDIITGSMMFTANGLNSGAQYYLAIRTDDTDSVSGDVVIEKSQNAYAWYIDGVKVNGNGVTLARDWEYDIELIVNDTVSLRELQQSSNGPFSHNAANVRNIHIPADVALGTVVTLHAYVTDDYVAAHYLNVTVAANNKIAISYENWTYTTDVNFQVNDALIQKINYEITYRNALFISESITGSVTVTKAGLYTASADIGSTLIYNGKIKIQSIIYNGNQMVLSTALSEITLNTNYGKGDGTAENPYKINAARHYMTFLFAAGACDGTEETIYWTMGADVTIPDSFSIPIPEFYGVFDGGGYTLSGLTLEIPASSFSEEQNYGWAAINKGTIKNVKFTDVTISAPVWHSGAWVNIGVAAGTNAGLIENVEVMGADVNTNRNMSSVGGIAGCNDSGATVINCIVGITIGNPNTVQIFSNGDTGLICGENWGTVDECLARLAAINYYATANNRSIGGIVGYCPAGKLTNCTTLIVGITVAGADAGIVPSMGTIVGNIKSSVIFTGNEDATIMDLEKLPESQRVNSNTGVSGTQYGYMEE